MLSNSTQTEISRHTVNLNDGCKFQSCRICSIGRKWSEPKLYVNAQNLHPSCIRFEIIYSLKKMSVYAKKFLARIWHLESLDMCFVEHRSKSSSWQTAKQWHEFFKQKNTTNMECMWFCPSNFIYHSLYSRQNEHLCWLFRTFRVRPKSKKNIPKSEKTFLHNQLKSTLNQQA